MVGVARRPKCNTGNPRASEAVKGESEEIPKNHKNTPSDTRGPAIRPRL